MAGPFFVTALLPILISRIQERGPLTVAEFMDLALYHPQHGYYAAAAQRSGREGDFFTSVDVGPLFGQMIAAQLDEMWTVLREAGAQRFHLVEAGAGNGRLARDILDAVAERHDDLHDHLDVTLVERSGAARAQQPEVLGRHRVDSQADLPSPSSVTGVILANELLDALPVHVVRMREDGLREVYIGERNGRLIEIEDAPSGREIADYVARMDVPLRPGTTMEAGLEAVRWMQAAAATIDRGFLLLVDYGHTASQLFATHTSGTLMAYRSHVATERGWLDEPGARDLTAHVNLTAVRDAAESAGLTTIGIVDQMYFLTSLGIAERLDGGQDLKSLARRLAAKTLLMPGGLGSTMKVFAFGRGIGRPPLTGLSSGRLT